MQAINWPELQPSPADVEALRAQLQAALPLRSVYRLFVEITLRAYPWSGRADLVSCYHPAQTYKQGQRIALFVSDPQSVHPALWLLGQVNEARSVQNPMQGDFQVLTLGIRGRQIQMAGGIPGAAYPEPDLASYSAGDLAWLVEWVLETYHAALQATLKRLIQNGQIRGQIVGETFLPEQVSALAPELFDPVFARISEARPWVSLEEIFRALPDLHPLERGTILALLRAALKEGPYCALGGDRWTTAALFKQLDRNVPLGLPISAAHAKGSTRTKEDEQHLAGYDGAFMPAEARRALEELGIGERSSALLDSPWQPPQEAVRLPTLNTLHLAQAYFPVGAVMDVFPPDVRLVFIQFIHGEHQPFILDRENALLKAVQPQELYIRILEEDIPAGTSLWLEYQGNERYRIAPRLLPFKRRVPCKLASLEEGRLHIEHMYVSMPYEGHPSLFKTCLRFEEVRALFTEASRRDRSVRDAVIHAVQAICATDPDQRAQRLDIFNTVFLEQMCSPTSVAVLLYTQPCFDLLGGGYFRYKPMQATMIQPRKRNDRLSRLWDDLLSDPVAPHPAAKERRRVGARSKTTYGAPRPFAPERELPSRLDLSETELPVIARSYAALEEEPAANIALQAEERIEPILMGQNESDAYTTTDEPEAVSSLWRESLEKLLHDLVEPVHADAEDEASSDLSIEAAHEESLSFSSPFHWEPKPGWVKPPIQSNSQHMNRTNPHYFMSKPRIPIHPLHKQPFYRRFFFYVRRWLSRGSRKTV